MTSPSVDGSFERETPSPRESPKSLFSCADRDALFQLGVSYISTFILDRSTCSSVFQPTLKDSGYQYWIYNYFSEGDQLVLGWF